eukprot:m.49182 g.49182  ORF g.49182 m.49182 type:complete len:354 (+) comp10602_c0_seq1:4363-5424(+)
MINDELTDGRLYDNDEDDGNEEIPLLQKDMEPAACPKFSMRTISGAVAVGFVSACAVLYVLSRRVPRSEWPTHNGTFCPAQFTQCRVLGTKQSDLAQIVLPTVIGVVLMTAWMREKPQRRFLQFVADNSKSAIAAMITHVIATFMARELNSLEKDGYHNECDWYIVVFFYDVVVSVTMTIILHQYTAAWARNFKSLEFLSRIGDYSSHVTERSPSLNDDEAAEPENTNQNSKLKTFQRWALQVAHWVFCAVIVRLFNFGVLFLLRRELEEISTYVGWWACSESQVSLKVWMNIVIFPLMLDSIQFLVQNYFLKNHKYKGHDKPLMKIGSIQDGEKPPGSPERILSRNNDTFNP